MIDTFNLTKIQKEKVERILEKNDFVLFHTYRGKNESFEGLVEFLNTMFDSEVERIEFEMLKTFLVEFKNKECYLFEFKGETLSYYVYSFNKIITKIIGGN